jgi:Zn-dependent alcohol dehydrogenase
MRAAILERPGSRIPIRDLEVQELRQGEVLLDVVAAGVCHSDYHLMDGHMQPLGLPWVLGHEGAGVVRETAPGVAGLSPGDKVILSLDAMCGYCRNCSLGSPALCETYPREVFTRMTLDGKPTYHFRPTYAEQTIALADACVKVPDDTNLHVGCLVSCGVITGIGAVVNRAKVEAGATMAVFGCGGVGLNVVQGGVLASASKIIAVDRVPYKLELAEQMGATHFINAATEDPVERIMEITGGGADYAFEVVGLPSLVRQALDSVRPTGTAVVVGVQPSDQDISVDGWHLLLDRALIGAFHGSARARVDFLWILDLYSQGRLKLDELVSRSRPLDEINEAFDDMNAGIVARTVLTFD